ncbi:uncharacterized protein DFL_000595 [Arthrobotrys flagrans]|uniref:Uncharacterized protein n=1 Tax=Arthrobotrys flagrans TaxID=97331 RepID=A0A437AE80_ARTFL|nr:hypothetical protein DFL_000595 [Arthrobotrys flagrans]
MKFAAVSACLLSAALLTSAAPVAPLQVENGLQGLSSALPRDIPNPVVLEIEKRGGPDEFHNPDVEWLNKFLGGLNGFFDGISRFFAGQHL